MKFDITDQVRDYIKLRFINATDRDRMAFSYIEKETLDKMEPIKIMRHITETGRIFDRVLDGHHRLWVAIKQGKSDIEADIKMRGKIPNNFEQLWRGILH